MPTVLPSEILGQPGVFKFLEKIYELQSLRNDQISDLLLAFGSDSPQFLFSQLNTLSIIIEIGNQLSLSPKGHQVWWLLQAINGGDLRETIQHLNQLDPTLIPYDIVKEGMTAEFVDNLASFPKFRRVLICSPWIHLQRKQLQKFSYALWKAEEKNLPHKVDVIAITRPLNKRDPNYNQFLEVFRALAKIGVEIVHHEKLHSKLYIRDPGIAGGFSQAIFGSENLTSKRNIELGIRITNDTGMINKLIAYFFDLYQECEPFKEG